MGGIPYTSTGCNTCRRRKVKCDETKPECMRCTNHGHKCTGYDRKRVFIHRHTKTAVENQTLASNSALVNRLQLDIPRQNVNPELRAQLLTNFIETYIPHPYLRDRTGPSLLQTLPGLTGRSAVLDKAVISISAAFLAKQNQDEWLLQYSSKLYGSILKILHGKITSGNKLSVDILYTTIVLQIYELINCAPLGFMAWVAHVQGSIAISSVQGEGTTAEKLFHRQLKYVTLCDAIWNRKTPYLYKTPIWWSNSDSKARCDPIDELIDLLAECCTIMEKVDGFFLSQPTESDKSCLVGDQLLRNCLKLEDDLHQTCLSMQGKLGTPGTFVPGAICPTEFRGTLDTNLFPVAFDFPSLACAESHMVYWATLILLYPLIGELLSVLGVPVRDVPAPVYYGSTNGEQDSGIPPSAEVNSAYTALAEYYAGEICRSVLYCLQPDMKALGAQSLLAPFSLCAQFFKVEGPTPKLQWCQGVLVALERLGLGLAPFLKDMVWPQYRAAQERRKLAPRRLLDN
ncbi:hypothetical protein BJX63DRAFT_101081 [Aspergillus granulosus]|uniref:Zn(2)-C6 fungal-type domain-containing protein n=1 Tax=Aspergillus granulosus TaxID=176169 RepID=A0ABR4GUU4_9EURO